MKNVIIILGTYLLFVNLIIKLIKLGTITNANLVITLSFVVGFSLCLILKEFENREKNKKLDELIKDLENLKLLAKYK